MLSKYIPSTVWYDGRNECTIQIMYTMFGFYIVVAYATIAVVNPSCEQGDLPHVKQIGHGHKAGMVELSGLLIETNVSTLFLFQWRDKEK